MDVFEAELLKLLRIHRKDLTAVTAETSIEGMDSLSITELCVLAEEELDVALEFKQVKPLKTYGELLALLAGKADK